MGHLLRPLSPVLEPNPNLKPVKQRFVPRASGISVVQIWCEKDTVATKNCENSVQWIEGSQVQTLGGPRVSLPTSIMTLSAFFFVFTVSSFRTWHLFSSDSRTCCDWLLTLHCQTNQISIHYHVCCWHQPLPRFWLWQLLLSLWELPWHRPNQFLLALRHCHVSKDNQRVHISLCILEGDLVLGWTTSLTRVRTCRSGCMFLRMTQ